MYNTTNIRLQWHPCEEGATYNAQYRVTRSSVNAWEMGLSTPTTQYVVALSKLFHVSADYILGLSSTVSLSLSDYSEEEVNLVYNLLRYIDSRK